LQQFLITRARVHFSFPTAVVIACTLPTAAL